MTQPGGRVERLLQALSLEEKVAMTAGSDVCRTAAVQRLRIPHVKMTDGPSGARGASFIGSQSACFPCGSALAATWNTDLVQEVGSALGQETRAKACHVLLGPTVNMHRSPLGGRVFEAYSEDPWLAARIATAFITGVQSEGVAACAKHFICNDFESERRTASADVDERALREIYLPPFEAAVKEAGVWTIMSAYNRFNGVFCGEHPLLRSLLKEEWGFDGVVLSDWWGTHSTVEAAAAGLDLEMPGPTLFRGEALLAAVRAGEVAEEVVDDMVRRVLRLAERTSALDQPEEAPERSEDRPEHRALARRAAAEAIVLLRNEGATLPLGGPGLRRLAVIGPFAQPARPQGGGSAEVNPHYAVSPLEGIRGACPDGVEVVYELGCSIDKGIPLLDQQLLAGPVEIQLFAGRKLEGPAVATQEAFNGRLVWVGAAAEGLPAGEFSARIRGTISAQASGRHVLSLASVGPSRLFAGAHPLIDNWSHQAPGESFFGRGSGDATAEVDLETGQPVALTVEFVPKEGSSVSGVRIGCAQPRPPDLLARAVAAAANADAAVVVVGTGPEWESEGWDRGDLWLPGDQLELLRSVAAANRRTVAVVNAGAPVDLEWVESVGAALVCWFGGQEMGNAIADVIFGAQDPSGRLPMTFPRRLQDTPPYLNLASEKGRVRYGEGIFIGYRYYDERDLEPRFCFGHGLSYTAFDYGPISLVPSPETEGGQGAGRRVQVRVPVTNVGGRPGFEVVQLYVGASSSQVRRPPRELKGFRKIWLQPGESQDVRFELDERSFAYWDSETIAWVVEPGSFELLVGSSSRDIRSRLKFELG